MGKTIDYYYSNNGYFRAYYDNSAFVLAVLKALSFVVFLTKIRPDKNPQKISTKGVHFQPYSETCRSFFLLS